MTTRVQTDNNAVPSQGPLHGWLTIAQVAEHLGIKKATLYHAVANAAALKQDWVKQESYPLPGGPRRWLINTDSEIFHYHKRRWKHRVKRQKIRRRKLRMRTIPPVSDFPFGGDEDENPLAVQEVREDIAFPTAWQSPFALPSGPPAPVAPPPISLKGLVQWKRGVIGLSILALLQFLTIVWIVKRMLARIRSDC